MKTAATLLALLLTTVAAGDDPKPDPVRIAALVRQLGHAEFPKREAATKELDAIGEPALDALRKATADPDAERSRRARQVIHSVTARADLEKLRGTWYTVSTSNGGATTGVDKRDTITYDGTRYKQSRGGRVFDEGTIEIIDAAARPKQIDYTVTDGLNKGLQARSIYTLDGDDHKICSVQGDRPAEFAGAAGFYRVMRRATPEDLRAPEVKFESAAFATDLVLAESKAPVHRVSLKCRPADGEAGVLTLDPTPLKFNAVGDPLPAGKLAPAVTVDFTLKLVKDERSRQLYELRGPKLATRLSLLASAGDAPKGEGRLLVHDKAGDVRTVIEFPGPPQPHHGLPIPCHPGCFPAGTAVRVPGGATPIDKLRGGDPVVTLTADGKEAPVKVIGVFKTTNRLIEVRVEGGTLLTTETQPLMLAGGGFRAAGELKKGDRVLRWVDGRRQVAAVRSVSAPVEEAYVFNLILGDPRAFVAADFVVRSKPPEEVRP
ncbi:MAG TPA: TIGR03067 domain-containing protein [Gemmataceae bacterium]|nr:TIGR03067 domain-containing protein [Gemmataceae bacterium]